MPILEGMQEAVQSPMQAEENEHHGARQKSRMHKQEGSHTPQKTGGDRVVEEEYSAGLHTFKLKNGRLTELIKETMKVLEGEKIG